MTKFEKLQQWLLYTPVGRHVLRNERIFYHNSVHNIFGYYSIQIGLDQINLLQGNKIPNHYTLGHDVLCDLYFLPFANNSIDLIVCPHTLEFNNNYQHILLECHRILAPNGKLIITSFNRSSFFMPWYKKNSIMQHANPATIEQLSSALKKLNFYVEGGKFFGYRPPINNAKMLSRLAWLDHVGDRWFPTYATNFGLIARKNVITPNLIMSKYATPLEQYEPQLGTAKVCKQIT